VWLEIFVFLAGQVAWTGLGGAGQFAVAYDAGMVAPAARAVHHYPLCIVGF